jgi:hypothetical protein
MADENRWFVEEFANPHSWLLAAENLHEQATALYRTRDRSSILTRTDANNRASIKLVESISRFSYSAALRWRTR